MNTKKAIKALKRRGWTVFGSKNKWTVKCSVYVDGPYTDRALINFARCFTSEYTEPWKPNVKHFRHRKNRSQTRQLLHHQVYEAFDGKKLAKDEDIWSWD